MQLTIALDRYDRHAPIFDGRVGLSDGAVLKPLEVGEALDRRHGRHRHRRMLRDLEFDVCEMSLSSFVMAASRDAAGPLVGVPAFPRRLFSLGNMFVNAAAGIETPADLRGRRVGIHGWQVAMSVLAKGDLKRDYGVAWDEIDWLCMNPENLPLSYPEEASVTLMPDEADIGELLVAGEIDALFSPLIRPSMLAAADRWRRLFPDPRAEEARYFRKHGFYPIMHLIVVRREVAERRPGLGPDLVAMFDAAMRETWRDYDDANYTLLAWGRNALEEQRRTLGPDPWASGVAANRRNLERFVSDCRDQRLIEGELPVERLFAFPGDPFAEAAAW